MIPAYIALCQSKESIILQVTHVECLSEPITSLADSRAGKWPENTVLAIYDLCVERQRSLLATRYDLRATVSEVSSFSSEPFQHHYATLVVFHMSSSIGLG